MRGWGAFDSVERGGAALKPNGTALLVLGKGGPVEDGGVVRHGIGKISYIRKLAAKAFLRLENWISPPYLSHNEDRNGAYESLGTMELWSVLPHALRKISFELR